MKTRSNLRASDARQASRKGCLEKRPGAFEHTRPSFFAAFHSPSSKEAGQCKP
jgi:hypothetical protein